MGQNTPFQNLLYRALPVLWLGFTLLPLQNAHAAWYWPFGQKGLEYRIVFTGINSPTYQWFKKFGLTKPNETNPPEDEAQLGQEAMALASSLQQALAAQGYYNATIRHNLAADETGTPTLTYNISMGPQYKIGAITFNWQGEELKPISPTLLQTQSGQPVQAAQIQQDAINLANHINSGSCLTALDVKPILTLYLNNTANLEFQITHGPRANFGATEISGTQSVNNHVILREVSWQQGECFNRQKIEQTQTALIGNQLFSSIRVRPARQVDAKGEVPVTITVAERAPRTLRAGASYSTDEDITLTTGWEHRNLFGNAEKLNADLSASAQQQSLGTTLRLPDYGARNQTLVLNAGLKNENRDAYKAKSLTTGASVERPLFAHTTGGIGVGYTLTQTQDALAGNSEYALLSLPTFLTYDKRDNVLDSRSGVLANLSLTPYAETFGEGGRFLKTQVNGQTYLSANTLLSPTLALKATAGSITGAKGSNVPSDVRFYAGGGGSVRGYGYQTLGPRVGSSAVGGSSFVTASAEMRLRFTEDFGGVAFADVGNVYSTELPDLDEKLYYGTGIGVRYFTAIGPLRADVALPMNGKDIGAEGYALYISIGQSF